MAYFTRLSLTALPSSRPQPATADQKLDTRQLTMDWIVLNVEKIKTFQTKTYKDSIDHPIVVKNRELCENCKAENSSFD